MSDSDRLFQDYSRRVEAERRKQAYRSARHVRHDRGAAVGDKLIRLVMIAAVAAVAGLAAGQVITKALANIAALNVSM